MLLDTMRKHSRSFIIYIFFGIIIAVFVVNFGPQSAGCVAGTTYAGSVAGQEITLNDLNYAIAVSGIRGRAADDAQLAQLKAYAMDRYIARELMAREAERRGIRVSDDQIRAMLLKGRYLALGQPRMLIRGENNTFDYNLFSKYVRYSWGITVKKFKAQQRRELLAESLRDALRSAVQVSPAEVKATFEHQGTRAKVSYVRFSPADFRDKVELSAAKLAGYIKANEAKLKKHYTTNKTGYSKLPPQAWLSVLQVQYDKAGGKPAALKKAKALHARLAKEPLAKLAKEASDHESAKLGGDLGWRDVAKPGVGGKALAAALKGLAKGKVSEVIEGEKSAWIIELKGKRQGDLTFDQAKDEIARDQLRDEESKRLAKAAAAKYIKAVSAGKKLEALFTTDDDAKAKKAGDDDAKKAELAKKKTEAPKKASAKAEVVAKSELRLRSTAFFPRSPYNLVPGIGISKPMMQAAFKLKEGEVSKTPFTVGSMVYLMRLDKRKSADMKIWNTRKDDMIERAEAQKADQQIRELTYELCLEAAKSNEVRVSERLMNPPPPPGAAQPKKKQAKPTFKYTPCKTLKPQPIIGGMGGMRGLRGLRGLQGLGGGRRPF